MTHHNLRFALSAALLPAAWLTLTSAIAGYPDPDAVVAEWSQPEATDLLALDVNFDDATWPNTWPDDQDATYCPNLASGLYINARLTTPVEGADGVTWPWLFRHCAFYPRNAGKGGCTPAFAKLYYNGRDEGKKNNWTQPGHTAYLEDDIERDADGKPTVGHAGFVQMCRDKATGDDVLADLGWVQVDHLPHVGLLQWSWSSTSAGRGIKVDVKKGSGAWEPLVWMGSDKQGKNCDGYTVYSDQGYFMEVRLDADDVSLRWRPWECDDAAHPMQPDAAFPTTVGSWIQAPRLHKVKIYTTASAGLPTATDAQNATDNPTNDIGTPSDLTPFLPDNAPVPPTSFVMQTNGTLSWLPADNATSYNIYRNDSKLGSSSTVTYSVGSTSLTGLRVTSVGSDGAESQASVVADHMRLLAFPGAVGFGKFASGGRGGKTVHVTSLADDGTGSLRWAFRQYPNDPITIVFDVSGTIQLQTRLQPMRDNWTLAGQTAPGEGILVAGNKTDFGHCHNFIVRNMRFRSGDKDATGAVLAENACGVENSSQCIFDHCCFGWSVEENLNTADSHFLTVQNSIVHEGLYNAGHSKGARGYGAQLGGSPATYWHNLFANNFNRSPRLNGARGEDYCVFLEYAGNVNWNFGKRNCCHGGENTANVSDYNGLNSAHECNFVGNYYKEGPAYAGDLVFVEADKARDGATSWAASQWYVTDNVAEGKAGATADNWSAMSVTGYTKEEARQDERIVPAHPYWRWTALGTEGDYVPGEYLLDLDETAEQAYDVVRKQAGTVNRDRVEQRLVADMEAGKCTYGASLGAGKGIIDRPTDAEGFYAYSTDYQTPTDTDRDGMPDEWETQHNLDPADAADANTTLAQGYTALEVYLNELITKSLPTLALAAPALTRGAAGLLAHNGTLTLPEHAVGRPLQVVALDGRTLYETRTAPANVTLAGAAGKLVVVVLDGQGQLLRF